MALHIVRNDIVKMDTEAIVNTANPDVTVGAGCDMAVYSAAGMEEMLSFRREKIGKKKPGESFVTPAFHLPYKVVIHTVSPFFVDGNHEEEKILRKCYKSALTLAKKHEVKSVAFPLISTGSYQYPKEDGMRIAVDEISAFLLKNEMDVYLVVFSKESTELGSKISRDLKEYIDENYVAEKEAFEYRIDEMPAALEMNVEALSYRAEPRRENNTFFRRAGNLKVAPQEEPEIEETVQENLFEGDLQMSMPRPSMQISDDDFYDRLEEGLKERMSHLKDTFTEYLLYLIKKKNLTNVQVYTDSLISKKVFSKIKNNKNAHPQKLTCLSLCIGARLNLDEAKDLLQRAGYAFSPCDKTDLIFQFFIENEIYDIYELDIQLEEHGVPCLIES